MARERARLAACIAVRFSLLRDLLHDASGLVERMLGPIMFADGTWRRRPFCGGLLLGLGDGGHVLALLLNKEKAAQDQCDQDYDNGSHGLNQSRLRAKGTLPRGCPDGR